MNSNLSKALAISLVGLGGGAAIHAQTIPGEWDGWCIGTNTAPYSSDFGVEMYATPFIRFGMGVGGTVTYQNQNNCLPGDSATSVAVPVTGRMGFAVGSVGSSQDDFQGLANHDEDILMTHGMNFGLNGRAGSGSGWSFIRIYVKKADGSVSSELFGGAGISTAYYGASNRYFLAESTTGLGVRVRCVADLLGDTVRLTWQLRNTTTDPLGIGMYYGAWAELTNGDLLEPNALGYTNPLGQFQPYILAGSNRPLIHDARFNRATDPSSFPSTLNFLTNQHDAYGLQLINSATPETSDSSGNSDVTPVDEVVIGKAGWVLSGLSGAIANPTFGDLIETDTVLSRSASFIQKWEPTVTIPGGTTATDPTGQRTIIAYYRTPWGDSSYFGGYTVVCDSPKTINLASADTGTLTPNPFTIRVTVDNTGGFGIVDKTIEMKSVRVTLNLPQGMHVPGTNSQQVVKYLNKVAPVPKTAEQWANSQVDFQVEVDPTVYGPLTYQVIVEPDPTQTDPNLGVKKTVNGVINIASAPKLLIRGEANLVGVPWIFTSNSWQDVLNPDTLDQSDPAYMHVDRDYRVFTWDPIQQSYVIETSPVRGKGSWIISSVDRGYRDLGGGPSQPTDMFSTDSSDGGADAVTLRPGWNLISNPYNFSIPVRQINGVPQNSSTVYTWDELVTNGLVEGSLTYYSPTTHSYGTLQSSDLSGTLGGLRLAPNTGYWLYVASSQNVTLQYPPVYDLWIRSAKAVAPQHHTMKNWALQLSALGRSSNDTDTYVGVNLNSKTAQVSSFRKAPLSPASDAMRAFVTDNVTTSSRSAREQAASEWGKALRSSYGKQSWIYNVATRTAGPVSVTWPNLAQLPRNLQISLTDLATGRKTDIRRAKSISFNALANSTKSYRVDVTPLATAATKIGYASASVAGVGSNRRVRIAYTVTQNTRTNIRVLQNGVEVYKVVTDQDDAAGSHTAIWNAVLPMNAKAPAGRYIVEISAEGEGGDIATRQVLVNLGK